MEYVDGFLKSCEAKLAEYSELRDRLESGQETLGKRGPYSRHWQDTTLEELARTKEIVARLEAVIAEHTLKI